MQTLTCGTGHAPLKDGSMVRYRIRADGVWEHVAETRTEAAQVPEHHPAIVAEVEQYRQNEFEYRAELFSRAAGIPMPEARDRLRDYERVLERIRTSPVQNPFRHHPYEQGVVFDEATDIADSVAYTLLETARLAPNAWHVHRRTGQISTEGNVKQYCSNKGVRLK